ncbi:ribosome production factor 2 [Tanacetum coccineum]
MLPSMSFGTRWNKSLSRKVNIFIWRFLLDRLPHRLNLSLRGLEISSIICPVCSLSGESLDHLFFSCITTANIWRKIRTWTDVSLPDFSSNREWIEWIDNWSSTSSRKSRFYIMLRIKTPKSLRAKRELDKRAPKLVEFGKKTLLLHGTKTSNVLNAVLTEIYHLKKDNSVKYSRRNDNIRPFESGGDTSLEFYSLKTDCSLFVFGSHSKKRPDNLVIGRTYDHHIYDLVEVGVENFKSMASYSYDKKLAPLIGSKPFFAFIGEGFENVEELKHLKEVLLDLFRGQVVKSLNLAGLDRVYVVTAVSSNKVFFTHCALRLKKSGTVVPRMELVEVGPSMDLVVRRHKLPDESLRKEAMKIAPELTKKKEKNVRKDPIEGKIGNIYVPDQQVGNASLPFKPKGVKRERREAKEAKKANGEGNRHAEKKQKQENEASA